MKRVSRRSALQLAMAAAIAPTLGPVRAPAAEPGHLIAPPDGPMRYSRAVTRELADGALFTVSREFTVEFRRFAGGFMLHGEQSRVGVEAPEILSDFADLERAREENGLFPLALDPFGQILSSRVGQPASEQVRAAVEEARALLAGQGISQDERERAMHFVATLQQAGQRVIAVLPSDLFAPTTRSRRDGRDIALPGGGHGRVETLFESERDSRTGLMRSATRNVMTSVADSMRSTVERWSLTAA